MKTPGQVDRRYKRTKVIHYPPLPCGLKFPPALVKAHADLDRAVDLCYRPQPF